MTLDDLSSHFDNDINQIAVFFNISREAIYQWKHRKGQLIPEARAMQAQLLTNGALVYNKELYRKKWKPEKK